MRIISIRKRLALFLSSFVLATGLMAGFVVPQTFAFGGNNDYPNVPKPYRTATPDSINDPWGGNYPNRECTSFVSWRLSSRNNFQTSALGNAQYWGSNAASRGFPVDMTPAIGAVAWFKPYVNGAGSVGHVAWVEGVNGNNVTLEEYNAKVNPNDHQYDFRVITASNVSGYIHFKDLPGTPTFGGVAGYVYLGKTLGTNATIYPGEYLSSPDARFALMLQPDGNLVLYNGTSALWSTQTNHPTVGHGVMQSDGNFVLFDKNGSAYWSSGTAGKGSSYLTVQGDGDVVIYNSKGATYSTAPGNYNTFALLTYANSDHLGVYGTLSQNQYLLSNDGRYALLMQSDGNLVLYGPGFHVLWTSGTAGQGPSFLTLQPDGNLVLYNAAGAAIWNSKTSGAIGPQSFVMQSDGNAVLYASSVSVFNTGTGGKI
jgi:surface antigen